jgi:predicted dienelactone hydrolase
MGQGLTCRSRPLALAFALAALVLAAMPAPAAQRITVRLEELERSVSVASLARFARDGQADADLKRTLDRLTPEQRQSLRTALAQRAPVTVVMVANFLATDLGQRILQQLVKVLDQPPEEAAPAVSSALILAAARAGEGGPRLIDVLETYPLADLRVNGVAVLSLVDQLSHHLNLDNSLFADLEGLGTQPAIPGPSLAGLAVAGRRPFSREPFTFATGSGAPIQALVLLPAGSGPFPLVVLAPGLNTAFNSLLYVGEHLASHGYAVAALDFPYTSGAAIKAAIQGTGAIPPANAWTGQPQTVSALIDQVERRWGERVDTNTVGVLGQSLGGFTTVALAGAPLDWAYLRQHCRALADPRQVVVNPAVIWQCQAPGQVVERRNFRDPRVRAAVAVNPVTSPIFSPASMAELAVPLLVIAGSHDLFAPPVSQQLVPYAAIRQADSLLVLQRNGTHLSFLNGDAPLPAFLIGPDRPLAQQDLRALSLAYFDRHLRQGRPATLSVLPAHQDGGVTMGRDPLPLLLRPRLSAQQLNGLLPGLSATP